MVFSPDGNCPVIFHQLYIAGNFYLDKKNGTDILNSISKEGFYDVNFFLEIIFFNPCYTCGVRTFS